MNDAATYELSPAAAKQEIRSVAKVVAGWREHFASVGVTPGDIEMLGEHIDRPFLREQREEYTP